VLVPLTCDDADCNILCGMWGWGCDRYYSPKGCEWGRWGK